MGGTCPSILLQQKQGFYHQEVLHLKGKQNTAPERLKLGGWVSTKTWLLGFPGLPRGPWWFNSGLGICPLFHPQRKKKWHWWLFKDMQHSKNSIFLSSRISAICRYICICPPGTFTKCGLPKTLLYSLSIPANPPFDCEFSKYYRCVVCNYPSPPTELVNKSQPANLNPFASPFCMPLNCQSSCWIVLGAFHQTQHPR